MSDLITMGLLGMGPFADVLGHDDDPPIRRWQEEEDERRRRNRVKEANIRRVKSKRRKKA